MYMESRAWLNYLGVVCQPPNASKEVAFWMALLSRGIEVLLSTPKELLHFLMIQTLAMATQESVKERNEKQNNLYAMKPGDKIRILRMDDNGGKDWQATRMNGKICTVRLIDSLGQIHLQESGLAVIPGVDEYEIIGE